MGLRLSGVRDNRQAIRDLLENWVVWRDAGAWERFRTVWHEEGRMVPEPVRPPHGPPGRLTQYLLADPRFAEE